LFPICSVSVVAATYSFTSAGGTYFHLAIVTVLIMAAACVASSNETQVQLKPGRATENIGYARVAEPAGASDVEQEEGLFRSVFDQASGMALVTTEGRWVSVNRSLCDVLGYAEERLLESSLPEVAHPDDVGPIMVQIKKLLEGSIPSYQGEQRFYHKLGHLVWMLISISLIRDSNGTSSHLIFQFQDITTRKSEEERLVHDVFHDALTGLPNRALFMDRLKLATERARRRKDQVFAVLFLDLDCFKTVNDSLGHIIGDQLLIEVARRLKGSLRTTDTVARLGGDEFTILLEDLNDEREPILIVERIQNDLRKSFKLGTSDLTVTASIGITSSTLGYERAEDVLRDADIAMYRAKSSGKECFQIFDRERHARPVDVLNLQADLSKAVEREELVLNYQPIVLLETGKLISFEALVRWQHPQRGTISPEDFVPLAEQNGSIISIGNWVLREACFQLKRWQEQFPFHASLTISVNLSGKQFLQPDFTNQVIGILQETGVDPRKLKLEITENVIMENIGTANIVLQQLRALGIELGIDDFGTGYSSLSYIHRLPVNSLKIDKSFVKGLVEKRDHAEIVKTILTLARSLGISVVAEGIETFEQLTELRRLQCDAGQGFLFAKPADAETAGGLLGLRNEWQVVIESLDSRLGVRCHDEEQWRHVKAERTRPSLLRAV